MRRLRKVLCLSVGLAGVAAAQVLVQEPAAMTLPTVPTAALPAPALPVPVPPVPAPTVPAPTVPAPTVPALPVPAPTVPALPVPAPVPAPVPTPPLPVLPTPMPTSPAVPTLVQAPQPQPTPNASRSAAAPTPSPGASPFAPAAGGRAVGSSPLSSNPAASRAAAPDARRNVARTGPLEARAARAKGRVRVRLEFSLPAARRLFLVVRGPAPSCAVIGAIPVRARAGVNVIHFGGRIDGRPVGPGIYLLTLSPTRRLGPNLPSQPVRVVSPRRTVPLARRAAAPTCSAAATRAADGTARFLREEPDAGPPPSPTERVGSVEASSAAPLQPPLQPSALEEIPEALPTLPTENGDETLEMLAFFGAGAVIGALLFTMLVLVGRFLRDARSA